MPDNPKETKNLEIIGAFFSTIAEKADHLELDEHELDSHARRIFSGITIEKLKSYIEERNRQRSHR
jgi:hypothetical protein